MWVQTLLDPPIPAIPAIPAIPLSRPCRCYLVWVKCYVVWVSPCAPEAEKAAHVFVGISSNRGTAAPGMLPPADSFEPANKSHIAHIYAGWGALSDRSALAPSGRGVPLGDPAYFIPPE